MGIDDQWEHPRGYRPEKQENISEILQSILPPQEEYHRREDLASEETPAEEPDAYHEIAQETEDPADPAEDTPDRETGEELPQDVLLDTYQDSGEYRSFDGNREYRSFDASLPEASPEDWYHYSQEDQELEEELDQATDQEDFWEEEPRRRHPVLSAVAHGLLVFLTAVSVVYLVGVYSNFSVVRKMRVMYIQTAMSTFSHKWMATALIPSDMIDDVMRAQYESDTAVLGKESGWGNVTVQQLPTFESETIDASQLPQEETQTEAQSDPAEHLDPVQTDEDTFFEIFWEIDRDSMQQYVQDHPEVLEDGWANIDINESGLEDDGTDIQTIYGDQVLAINASQGIMLARLYLSANESRGIMAICKDTSRLKLCTADTLGTIGQTVANICDYHDGILAITGSAFYDPDGQGNGGEISGLAVCSGEIYGERLSGTAKRLELRDDNKMYIVDSDSQVGEGTRDACEFQPAVLIDGEIISSDWNSPNPRAVLGQTKRLETMMVVVEGRLSDSLGCGVEDIGEKMLEYGCVQALNLDGGTSAMMYYKGESIIRCSNQALPDGRTLPTAWVYGGT